MISSDNLNVPSEEEVYRAVLSWVKHDIDGRRQHVPWVRLCLPVRISQHALFSVFQCKTFLTLTHSHTLNSAPSANEVCAAAAAEARLSDEQR